MSVLWRALTGVFSLHDNATHGRLALVRANLALGSRWIDAADGSDEATTPLHAAAYNGHLPVVKLLIARGANTAALTAAGWSALHCAASNGYLPVVRFLVEEVKLRPTLESKDGWTALHCGAAHGFLPVVKYLVDKQHMDVDFTTFSGWTALHWSCCNGYLSVVKYLLSAGADRSVRTRSCGSTILHVAARQGQAAVVQFLLGEEARPIEDATTANATQSPHSAHTVHAPTNNGAGSDEHAVAASSSSPAVFAAPSAASAASHHSPTLHAAAAGESTMAMSVTSVPLHATSAPSAASSPLVVAVATHMQPVLSTALVTARNDAGADAFLLACLRGKLPVVELLAARLGRHSFTLAQLQAAHDAHQGAARRPGGFLNHQLVTYLRQWMHDVQYGQRGTTGADADAAHPTAAPDSAAETARMRAMLESHERGERLPPLVAVPGSGSAHSAPTAATTARIPFPIDERERDEEEDGDVAAEPVESSSEDSNDADEETAEAMRDSDDESTDLDVTDESDAPTHEDVPRPHRPTAPANLNNACVARAGADADRALSPTDAAHVHAQANKPPAAAAHAL